MVAAFEFPTRAILLDQHAPDPGHSQAGADTVLRLFRKPGGWIMGTFACSRCVECNEDKFFSDGSMCARCLSLSYVPIDDEDGEDSPKESLRIPLDRLAA
jgi:hypothetical protein